MTHPAILERTADIAVFIEDNGGTASFEARGIATNPRATAVASLFAAKLLGKADDIPVEDLVTPESLSAFQRLLEDDDAVAALRPGLSGMGLVWPRVQPQSDGSVLVQLVPKGHAATNGNGADATTTPAEQPTIGLRVRLVNEPDDWRVEWSSADSDAASPPPRSSRSRPRKSGTRSRTRSAKTRPTER